MSLICFKSDDVARRQIHALRDTHPYTHRLAASHHSKNEDIKCWLCVCGLSVCNVVLVMPIPILYSNSNGSELWKGFEWIWFRVHVGAFHSHAALMSFRSWLKIMYFWWRNYYSKQDLFGSFEFVDRVRLLVPDTIKKLIPIIFAEHHKIIYSARLRVGRYEPWNFHSNQLFVCLMTLREFSFLRFVSKNRYEIPSFLAMVASSQPALFNSYSLSTRLDWTVITSLGNIFTIHA